MDYLTSDLSWVLPLRSEELTMFFKMFPLLVSETFYLVFLGLGCWCWRKDASRDMIAMLCLGVMVNVLLKSIFQYPRPTIEHLVLVSESWTFPSGDAMSASIFWFMLALFVKRKWVWGLSVIMVIGTASSRVYFGVHYPVDVTVGLIIGSLMVWTYYILREGVVGAYLSERKDVGVIALYLGMTIYFVVMRNHLTPLNVTAAGTLWGVLVGYQLEGRLVEYREPHDWGVRLIVGFVGLMGLFFLKYGLKHWFVFGDEYLNRFFAYAVIGFFVIFLMPLVVQKFSDFRQRDRVLSA